MRKVEATGKSVDEAIYNGLVQMGLSIDEVDIEIVSQGSRGLFGLGGTKVVVALSLIHIYAPCVFRGVAVLGSAWLIHIEGGDAVLFQPAQQGARRYGGKVTGTGLQHHQTAGTAAADVQEFSPVLNGF